MPVTRFVPPGPAPHRGSAPRRGPAPSRGPAWPPPTAAPRQRRRRRPGRILGLTCAIVVLAVLCAAVYVDRSLQHVDALADYPGRLAPTAGTNWLIVGSDSRAGLTPAQEARLTTGDEAAAGGSRTDTIMLMHIPALLGGGQTTLVSLPRDSSVPLAGYGRVKLNAAFSIGGPALLAQTVEKVTGVHIDHYAEIGFAGFADLVDDVGGVQMCPTEPINDPLAGLNIAAGCQMFDGPKALGYVRTRHSPRGDLDRVVRQREFLGALIAQVTSPAVLINPFRMVPLGIDAPGTITVDNGDHVWNLARLGWAMRALSHDDAVTTTVPFSGFGTVSDGSSAVLWDKQAAARLFNALAQDQAVPH
ncbi:MAG: LCP family protein [Pseudonocardiales bacterium]|nr:LCP family protein [Pseudonocardiales bacterium]